MYEEFYGLQASPFTLSPSIKCFYHSRSHRRAFITLYFALLEGEGILVLTGPPGIGKTTVIKALQGDLEKLGEYKFVHLDYAPSADELASAVAQEITGQTEFQD